MDGEWVWACNGREKCNGRSSASGSGLPAILTMALHRDCKHSVSQLVTMARIIGGTHEARVARPTVRTHSAYAPPVAGLEEPSPKLRSALGASMRVYDEAVILPQAHRSEESGGFKNIAMTLSGAGRGAAALSASTRGGAVTARGRDSV